MVESSTSNHRNIIFIGLMLGMLVAATNQTIVSPAMPVIVAVLPLRLWKNPIFTLSNVSNMTVTMAMYGALFFIPIYAQGVIGVSVMNSGVVLIPLMFSTVGLSILVGRLITRTGRYKGFVLAGLIVMGSHTRHRHGQQDEDRDPPAPALGGSERFAVRTIL